MTAETLVRGWCPSLLQPMESGDGWLARVRPQAGVLAAPLVSAVAEAAARFGNGIVEVTNRANLQIRGLRPETIAPFTAAIEAAGGVAGEGSRVLVSPLLGADPCLAADTAAILRAVDAGLADIPLSHLQSPAGPDPRVKPGDDGGEGSSVRLPAKFGVVLDGGGVLPLTGVALDVTIRCRDGVWQVNGEASAAGDVAARVRALAAAGLPRVTTRDGDAPQPGYHAMGTSGFALLVPAFGQIQAEALAGLAGLAVRYGEGGLRPTPWKSLCIAGIAASDAETVLSASAALGLVTWADDGRLSIITCAGAPACSRAEVETITTAAIIARTRRAGDALLHLSGCAKGCAHPGPAPLTLVGHEGKFDLVRGGKASETPETRDVALAQISPLMQSLPS